MESKIKTYIGEDIRFKNKKVTIKSTKGNKKRIFINDEIYGKIYATVDKKELK